MSSCRVSSSRILSKLSINVPAFSPRTLLLLRQFKGLDELCGDVGMVSLLSPLEVDWPHRRRLWYRTTSETER